MIASGSQKGIHAFRRRAPTGSTWVAVLAFCFVMAGYPLSAHAAGSGPPVNTALPTLKGTPKVGKSFKAKVGKWAGAKTITYSYQWQVCNGLGEECTNINGATAGSYTPSSGQVGDGLDVIVTATNGLGKASAASLPNAPVISSAKSRRINLCGTIGTNHVLSHEAALVYVLTCDVTVPAGVTLTAASGAIVKAEAPSSISVKGVLRTEGTTASPVTLTSVNDNSVGGATGTGTPKAGEWGGLWASEGGALDVEHSVVRYGASVGGESASAIAVVSDVFDSDGRYAAVEATGSTVRVEHNSFVSPTGSAAIVSSPHLTLAHNVASGVTVSEAYSADSDALDFGGLSSNAADHGGLAVSGAAATSEWTGSLPLLLETGGVGYPFLGTAADLDVPKEVTLALAPGSVIKGQGAPNNDAPCGACAISVEGSLIATGTSSQPITFTSARDTSIDGDTAVGENNDGHPAAGDWAGIAVAGSASVHFSFDDFRYASGALFFRDLSATTVSYSDFAYDREAIAVEGTANEDPALAALDCVPPYLAVLAAQEDFFGRSGYPPPSLDLASVVGAVLPSGYSNTFGAGETLAGNTFSLYGSDDTIPWSIYSCPELAIPPIPVTPVIVAGTPAQPWFPDPEAP